jgi:hypothetical protein
VTSTDFSDFYGVFFLAFDVTDVTFLRQIRPEIGGFAPPFNVDPRCIRRNEKLQTMTRTILGSSPTLWQKRASQVVQRCSKTPRQDRSSRCSGPRRHLVVPTSSRTSVVAGALPDPSLVDARYAPNDFDPSCAVVYRDFITSEEADLIANEMLSRMKRCVTVGSLTICCWWNGMASLMLCLT